MSMYSFSYVLLMDLAAVPGLGCRSDATAEEISQYLNYTERQVSGPLLHSALTERQVSGAPVALITDRAAGE